MKLVLGMEVGLSPGDFVLDGDPVPFPKKGAEPPPQFTAHFYCGQKARCIKMPLATNWRVTGVSQNCAPYMGSWRGWLAGALAVDGGVLNITAAALTAGFL